MIQQAPLFALGRTRKTPDAVAFGPELDHYIQRHVAGDWGRCGSYAQSDVSSARNEQAIRDGGSVASLYDTPHGWLVVRTGKLAAGGMADANTETWCLLPDESWAELFDGRDQRKAV